MNTQIEEALLAPLNAFSTSPSLQGGEGACVLGPDNQYIRLLLEVGASCQSE
jgi:hypothetical protein